MKPSPRHSKIGPQLEDFRHGPKSGAICLPKGTTRFVLILDPGLIRFQLAQHHHDGLQNIQRFESGDGKRLIFILRDPLVPAGIRSPWTTCPGPMNASMRMSGESRIARMAGIIVTCIENTEKLWTP